MLTLTEHFGDKGIDMRSVSLASILASSLFLTVPTSASDTKPDQKIVPQALPVLAWCKGSKTGDVAVLKTVFSERVVKQHDRVGWEEVARRYKAIFADLFGDYELDQFSFEFEGTETEGRVKMIHPNKTVQGVAVIKEGEAWKVNEK